MRVVSERIRQSLDKGKISLRRNSTILPVYFNTPPQIPSGKNLRQIYPQFENIIFMASRLTSEKNISLALNVFVDVLKNRPKTGLVVVGSGPLENRLQKEVGELNIEKNVVFEPWQSDLAPYYQSTDIFLLTSNFEGFGLTLIESALSGCPIVTTDVGEASFTLKDSEGALVCPVGDEKCLVDSVLKIFTDTTLANRLKNESQRVASILVLSKEEYLTRMKTSWERIIT